MGSFAHRRLGVRGEKLLENDKKRNLILIGFMGTGKSSVGKMLADMMNYKFVDTDSYIESKAGSSIPELFASRGEDIFRQLEQEAIQEILHSDGLVVSTGGGSILREENRAAMLAGGQVIALTADADSIIARVSQDPNRPLLQGSVEERVHTLLEQRKDAYRFADLTIDTTDLSVDTIVGIILAHHR